MDTFDHSYYYRPEDNPTMGRDYISCGCLCVGDYGGAGSIGEANIRSLEADSGEIDHWPDAVDEDGEPRSDYDGPDKILVVHGDYSSRQLWIPDTILNREFVERLETRYPVIDDEEMYRVESEWEEEGLDSYYLRYDIRDSLREHFGDIFADYWGDLDREKQLGLYWIARQHTNDDPYSEYSGVSFPSSWTDSANGEIVRPIALELLSQLFDSARKNPEIHEQLVEWWSEQSDGLTYPDQWHPVGIACAADELRERDAAFLAELLTDWSIKQQSVRQSH